VFLALPADARKLTGDIESRRLLGCGGGNGSLCTELIDTKLYTCRDADASHSKYSLAHCKCKSLMQRSSRLLSVCPSVCLDRQTDRRCLFRVRSRKLREIGAKFRHLYRKLGSPSKNMTSYFALERKKDRKKYDGTVLPFLPRDAILSQYIHRVSKNQEPFVFFE